MSLHCDYINVKAQSFRGSHIQELEAVDSLYCCLVNEDKLVDPEFNNQLLDLASVQDCWSGTIQSNFQYASVF